MKSFFYVILTFPIILSSQIFTESNLPIIFIDTDNEEIPDEPRILATMGIIDNGPEQTNFIWDDFNHFDGYIGIETRGNSTQGFEKKTYRIELWDENENDISESLLGMPEEEDWILHSMVIDKTQLRIPLSFYLFQRMGHYSSNWKFVELVINDEYQGLYILCENIKRDNNRVDIAKLEENDTSGDEVTGGYILRIDWLGEPGFESNYDSQEGTPMFFQWYYPKADNMIYEQSNYIEDWITNFENAVFSPSYYNSSGFRYNEYIDLNSFTDFLLINELSKNADGYKLSTYIHKERDSNGGKLNAGPIWDFDQTFGVSLVCSNHDYTGWTYLQNQPDCEDLMSMPMWWQHMMEDELFTNHLNCRWNEMRSSFLHQDSIFMWIDNHEELISNAVERNFERWDDFIGEYIWIEPEPIPETYDEEILAMKNWISNRLLWLDSEMPGNCNDTEIVETNDDGNKNIIMIIDRLGRQTNYTKNKILIYVYDDGTTKRKLVTK